jgi:hypothetical protein
MKKKKNVTGCFVLRQSFERSSKTGDLEKAGPVLNVGLQKTLLKDTKIFSKFGLLYNIVYKL